MRRSSPPAGGLSTLSTDPPHHIPHRDLTEDHYVQKPSSPLPKLASGGSRRRQSAVVAAALALALAAAGCGAGATKDSAGTSSSGTSSSATNDSGTPQQGGDLKIAFDLNVQNCLDPGQAYGLEQRDLDRNVVDSLTDQDSKTGKIIPWLATSWSSNSTGSEYTFHLRRGVTFSNGQPFNAAAVKASFDNTYKLGALSLFGVIYLAGYQSTTVVNPYTVRVNFKQPNAQFLQATATTTLGIEAPASFKYTPAQRCLGHFWGSGPFTLTSFTPGESATLTRRDGYRWASAVNSNKGNAYLQKITATWITQDSVLVGSLDSGQLDLAWPRDPLTQAEQQQITSSGGSIFSRPYPGISDILMPNVSKGRILSDPDVRQALQESINRKEIATTVYWSGYPVVTSPLETTTPDFANESSLLGYDPTAAKTLLQKDGWVTGKGGYRYKGGKELTLIEPITEASPITDLLQAQLKLVGINLVQKELTTAQYDDTVDDPGGNYDLMEDYFTRADPSILGTILDTALVKTAYAQQSQTKSVGSEVSTLFAKGADTTKAAARASVYAKLQADLVKDDVAFPLDERLEVTGVSSKVHGLEVNDEGIIIANNIWLSK
jgi:peptide/nickel transport system substrate-binding protein